MNASDRIQWLHRCITDMRYPNANRLAERFGISHRQAQRDVDSLRRDFGAPLAYNAEHRGFYYTKAYTLPAYTICASDEDPVDAVMGAEVRDVAREIVQMQIPYTAVLSIPDKLTRLELKRFIVDEEARGCYVCEFHNVELFLGILFTAQSDIVIQKPDWLRERYVQAAQRVLRANRAADQEK